MTIALTGSGGLFTRLGYLGGALADVNALRGGTATARVLAGASMQTRVATTLEAAYAASVAQAKVIDGIFTTLSSFQSSQASFLQAIQQLAQQTVIQMANTDTPLASLELKTALALLSSQMVSAGASINQSTVSLGASTAVGIPNGNPVIVLSPKNAQGLTLQTIFPETLTFACTSDSQSGGATLNQEPVKVTGAIVVADVLSHLWPGGSGVNQSLTCVNPTQNNSAGNVLQNSEFLTTTTANVPDNWTPLLGTPGTDIFVAGSGYFDTSSLQFTGTAGALLDAVTQSFRTTPNTTVGAGGTSYALLPDTIYALNCWVKCSATPTAGVLEFSLTDGSNTTITDDQAVANLFTKSLTAVSTSWVNVNGVFRTPLVLPVSTPYKLKIRLSTAIDIAKSVFIDRVALSPMTLLYTGGPSCSIFSGNTKLIAGDNFTVAVTNTMGGFAALLEKFFGMRALGIQLPYSGSPTVADSLIV